MKTRPPVRILVLSLLCFFGGLANAQSTSSSASQTTIHPTESVTLPTLIVDAPAPPDTTSAGDGSPPLVAPESQPQIAFPLLKTYAEFQLKNDEQQQRVLGWMTTIIGGLLFVGGTTGLIYYSEDPTGSLADMNLQNGAVLSLSGTLSLGFGVRDLISLSTRPRLKEYQMVVSETDLVLREATAAATLKGWSDDARNRRVLAGFLDFALAPIILGISALAETSQGKPWYSGYSSYPAIPLVSVVYLLAGGVALLQTSPEERLYQKYLTARDAVYSLPSQDR